MPADYIPIACAEHERLEFAVLRRIRLRLVWLSITDSTEYSDVVLPLDVATRDGAEWLTIRRSSDETELLRLDCIRSVVEV
jgi:Rho-binding antiterminator